MKTMLLFRPVILAISLLSTISLLGQIAQITKVETSLRPEVIHEGAELFNIKDRLLHYNTPGISIAVIKDHKLHWAKSYGTIENFKAKPITPSTAFQSASISKLVSAVGVMRLVQSGKLDLDKEIHEYLKSWKLPPSEDYPNAVITTRMLLAHIAGLSTHGFGGYKDADNLPTAIEILDKASGVNSGKVRIIKKPGESFKYSGGGTMITQVMIEDITGMSYTQYMQEEVLKPLSMENSFYSINQKGKEPRLATAHKYNGKPLKNNYQHYPESAPAGLWSTPTDLSKIMIDLMLSFNGEEGHLLTPSLAQSMLIAPIEGENNALGMFRTLKEGHLYFEHGGSNEGFKAQFIGSAENGMGAIVMTNGEQYDIIPEVINSVAQVYDWPGWFTADHVIPSDIVIDKSLWKTYKGIYTHTEDANRQLEIKTKQGQLHVKRKGEWELPLIPVANSKYMIKGANPRVTVEFKSNGDMEVFQGELFVFRKE